MTDLERRVAIAISDWPSAQWLDAHLEQRGYVDRARKAIEAVRAYDAAQNDPSRK